MLFSKGLAKTVLLSKRLVQAFGGFVLRQAIGAFEIVGSWFAKGLWGVSILGFRVLGLGFRVLGLGF